MTKRLFDIFSAAAALIVLSPLFLIISVCIKREDGGPVFYRGLRVGRSGRQFKMLKFRTMVVNADRVGGPSAAADDPRITRAGSVLRRYKLDELPQLINVLRGEMSIVGPRPEVPFYVAMFTATEQAILSVRPGITDWASMWNSDEGAALAGSPDPEKTYMEEIRPEKIRLQLRYVADHRLAIDFKIIALTLAAIFIRQTPGAIRARASSVVTDDQPPLKKLHGTVE
jgi:lipopolysaccharide/colanic/teichoic acid biosynthesis glycosyltransferase